MVPGARGFGPLDRLGFRLVILLGVSLLPIGLIAVIQTYRTFAEANESIEAALLGETLNAAAAERRIVNHSMGVAEVLATLLPDMLDDPERCSARMTQIVDDNDNLFFGGFLDMDGVLACSTLERGRDLSSSPVFQDFIADPKPRVTITLEGAVSRQTALLVIHPVRDEAQNVLGMVSLTVPLIAIALEDVSDQKLSPFDILTFDATGTLLTSEAGLASVESRLPLSRNLDQLSVNRGVVFRDEDRLGNNRIFTVVPIVRGQIFALATWPSSEALVSPARLLATVAFPILMWLTSVVVAFVAVHRLVIRHIRSLRRNIRTFSLARRVREQPELKNIPTELREVIDAFGQMTQKILRDEADQANLLHEKDVLLKEVHHRVKNNLQLIASITNMQIRKARHPESRFMLRRLQDRVMSLATVHRSLYEASVFSEVRADALIADIARQMANSSIVPGAEIDFSLETEPVLLYPDQAVPLSLLVTEAVTNAFKYLGHPAQGAPWVTVALTKTDSGSVCLLVRNSVGPLVMEHGESGISGLGSQLIGAFVMQLGGQSDTDQTDEYFSIRVIFDPADFDQN